MITFRWRNWNQLKAVVNDLIVKEYLREVGQESITAFRRGSEGAGGGPVYPSARRSASLPGQYPAIQSGALIGSLDATVSGTTLDVSVDTPYAQYLLGTSKMAPRKLVDDALKEGLDRVEEVRYARNYAYFTYGGSRLK